MSRISRITLGFCAAAAMAAGCQSTSPQTAAVERSRPSTFWSADGNETRADRVAGQSGATPFRLTSKRSGDETAVTRTAGGRAERIPLPRTDTGGLRDVDGVPAKSIGAF